MGISPVGARNRSCRELLAAALTHSLVGGRMLHVARIAALVVMVAATAEAQELAGTFEQLRVLVKSGETLTVTDTAGARIRGRLSQLSSSSLMLNVSGTDREFQSAQVDRIEKRGPDSLKNGALTGFIIGGWVGGIAI